MTIIASLLFSPPLVSFTAKQQQAIIWTTGANYANERTLGWPMTFSPSSHLFTVCKLPRGSETCPRMSKDFETNTIRPQKKPVSLPSTSNETVQDLTKKKKNNQHHKPSVLLPGDWVRDAFYATEVVQCSKASYSHFLFPRSFHLFALIAHLPSLTPSTSACTAPFTA